jgi:superfamily II DNA/RNA helicase
MFDDTRDPELVELQPNLTVLDGESGDEEEEVIATISFADLGINQELVRALKRMGVEHPTPIQALTLTDALAGRDICGKASTGSGKTLAFGLPLLQNTKKARSQRPAALVLVPTRELAVQVKEVLSKLVSGGRGLWIEAFYGGVPIDRQIRSLRKGVDILVATPGRLIDLLNRGAISLGELRQIVIDEADLMADMGFLPSVEEILSHASPEHQTMLFSATLDGDIDRVVSRYMSDPLAFEVPKIDQADVTMTHHFYVVDGRDKAAMIEAMSAGSERTLVFVRTRDGAERLTYELEDMGVDAEMLTGGVKQGARERVLRKFSAGRVSVLVATDVAARGLDISGLDLVVHYDMPDDNKSFVHRSGRTARAGEAGVVVTLVQRNQIRSAGRIKKDLGIDGELLKVSLDDPALRGVAVGEVPQGEVIEVFSGSRGSSSGAPRRSSGGYGRGGFSSREGSSGRRPSYGSGRSYGSDSSRGDSPRGDGGRRETYGRRGH